MLQITKISNNDLVFCGDIHGTFESFVFTITQKLNFCDVNIIVCGDFGVGFYQKNYYVTLFKKLNKKLKKCNIHIYAFRGNHDDPKYFNDSELKQYVLNGITNIHLVDDYDIIQNDNHNILCIGGARSVDKCKRWTWDKQTQTRIPCGWWEGEMIKDLPDEFDAFCKNNNINIDIVCSHSAPNFCEPLSKAGLKYWQEMDNTVIEDCNKERQLLSDIYNNLKTKHNIKKWIYGHFHNSYILIDNDILFRGLNMFNDAYSPDFYYDNVIYE